MDFATGTAVPQRATSPPLDGAARRGDNSDNLPGVPGVGEKTAAKLINKYGGLDGIFENVADPLTFDNNPPVSPWPRPRPG